MCALPCGSVKTGWLVSVGCCSLIVVGCRCRRRHCCCCYLMRLLSILTEPDGNKESVGRLEAWTNKYLFSINPSCLFFSRSHFLLPPDPVWPSRYASASARACIILRSTHFGFFLPTQTSTGSPEPFAMVYSFGTTLPSLRTAKDTSYRIPYARTHIWSTFPGLWGDRFNLG